MKFLKLKFLNNKGFTLVEVLVAAGLMGLVALALGSLLNNALVVDKHTDKKADSVLFLAGFGQFLLTQRGCSAFVGRTPTIAYADMSVNTYRGYGSHRDNLGNLMAVTAPAGTPYVLKERHVEIESFEYRFKDDAVVVSKNIDGNIKSQRILQVRLRIRVSQKGFTLASGEKPGIDRINEKYYEIPVLTNPANSIESCDINMSQAQICEILNLIYDSGSNSCLPNPGASSCIVKGSYATVSCTPGGYGCNSSFGGTGFNYFTGAASCSPGETAYRTGHTQSSYTVGCGKKCTVRIYVNESFYTCMICPP